MRHRLSLRLGQIIQKLLAFQHARLRGMIAERNIPSPPMCRILREPKPFRASRRIANLRASSDMSQPILVLLPGLDGTGDLFGPLLDVIPKRLKTLVIRYPVNEPLPYVELLRIVEKELRSEPGIVLIAESFSGPLAQRYAAAHPEQVKAVALCVSFISAPLPRWLRHFARPLLFRIAPPDAAVRRLLVGPNAPDSMVQQVKRCVRNVRREVLACRLRDVFDVDCSDDLRRCLAPILCIVAARDALVRRSSINRILAIRPTVTVVTIDGPHLLLQSKPASAWREIVRFLKENQARSCVLE